MAIAVSDIGRCPFKRVNSQQSTIIFCNILFNNRLPIKRLQKGIIFVFLPQFLPDFRPKRGISAIITDAFSMFGTANRLNPFSMFAPRND